MGENMAREKRGELRTKVEEGKEQLCQYEALSAAGILSKQAYTLLAQPLKAKVATAEAELNRCSRRVRSHIILLLAP